MFESGEEEQQPCVVCRQPNEQMLMLSCVHDPCINCAATHYVENQPPNSLLYTCSKCGQETQLDKSSIVQLQKLYSSLKKRKKVTTGSTYKDRAYPQDEYRASEVAPVRTRNEPLTYSRGKDEQIYGSKMYSDPQTTYSKKGVYAPTYPCNDHPEQDLTYYCFSCTRPICPECAIHGKHREHEVQTTRKAIKQIKGLLTEDKQKLDAEINDMLSSREQAKRLTKEWAEQNKRDQDFIRKKISIVRNVLAQKEKELFRATEQNLERNTEILRNQAAMTDKTLQQIAGVKRNIDSTMKKEDLTVLQEYNQRDQEATAALNLADNEKQKSREQQLNNPLRCVDLGAMQEDIDRIIGQLQALKLTTVVPKP